MTSVSKLDGGSQLPVAYAALRDSIHVDGPFAAAGAKPGDPLRPALCDRRSRERRGLVRAIERRDRRDRQRRWRRADCEPGARRSSGAVRGALLVVPEIARGGRASDRYSSSPDSRWACSRCAARRCRRARCTSPLTATPRTPHHRRARRTPRPSRASARTARPSCGSRGSARHTVSDPPANLDVQPAGARRITAEATAAMSSPCASVPIPRPTKAPRSTDAVDDVAAPVRARGSRDRRLRTARRRTRT